VTFLKDTALSYVRRFTVTRNELLKDAIASAVSPTLRTGIALEMDPCEMLITLRTTLTHATHDITGRNEAISKLYAHTFGRGGVKHLGEELMRLNRVAAGRGAPFMNDLELSVLLVAKLPCHRDMPGQADFTSVTDKHAQADDLALHLATKRLNFAMFIVQLTTFETRAIAKQKRKQPKQQTHPNNPPSANVLDTGDAPCTICDKHTDLKRIYHKTDKCFRHPTKGEQNKRDTLERRQRGKEERKRRGQSGRPTPTHEANVAADQVQQRARTAEEHEQLRAKVEELTIENARLRSPPQGGFEPQDPDYFGQPSNGAGMCVTGAGGNDQDGFSVDFEAAPTSKEYSTGTTAQYYHQGTTYGCDHCKPT